MGSRLLWFSSSVVSDSLWPHGLQYPRLSCPSPSPRVCSNSSPLSQGCHPTSHPLSLSSPPVLNFSQHQGLFQCVSSSQTSQVMLVVKNPPANAGDVRDSGSIPRLGGSPGEENGNPLQYSCLENPMDRVAWQPAQSIRSKKKKMS